MKVESNASTNGDTSLELFYERFGEQNSMVHGWHLFAEGAHSNGLHMYAMIQHAIQQGQANKQSNTRRQREDDLGNQNKRMATEGIKTRNKLAQIHPEDESTCRFGPALSVR